MTAPRLRDWLNGGAAAFDDALASLLPEPPGDGRTRLDAAIRHGVLSGGKRLRPYLVLESARLMGVGGAGPLHVAAALECVHCYSLIHDDLPAMDDDDLRRGRPTVHRAFDEATAILAGDALLTHAFALLARPGASPSPQVRIRLVAALAEAAGASGMVGGQMLDLAAEGRFGGGRAVSAEEIVALQGMKTGALIVFGASAGALLHPEASEEDRAALAAFGRALGLAFQIRDDLIDVEVDAAVAGKATGKDGVAGKGTFVTLLGVDGAYLRLKAATAEADAALRRFGAAADPLREALDFNRTRLS